MAVANQIEIFNERLSKIGDPRNVSYFDPESGMNVPKRLSKQKIKSAAKKRSSRKGLIWALIIAATIQIGATVAALHVGAIGQLSPAMIVLAGALLSVLVCSVLRLYRLPHLLAQVVGGGAVVAGLHNLVLLAPDAFSVIYSPEFVANIQATSELGSVVFLGQTVSF